MTSEEKKKRIDDLKIEIASLPKGYISKKTIGGKIYYYHQWSEGGQKKSKYLNPEEAESLEMQLQKKKELQAQLDTFLEKKTKMPEKNTFSTNVVFGAQLKTMADRVKNYEKRDCYSYLHRYLYGDDWTRVCTVYGLRRTGKTTMLLQAIADMSNEDRQKAAYIKLRSADTMVGLNRDMNLLFDSGFRYIFLDEVTLMRDFIDSAAVLSDIFVPSGMRIVLSGTDSLGFMLAKDDELYDRERMIHTTFISFREYSRLLGIDSIDEYIRYGGTFRAGELAFDDEDATAEDASFRDDESTRRYVDTAIAKNIQHSLECYEYGNHFRHLQSLYEKGELTGAINRIIEDINHRFVLSVLTKDFVSSDLGLSARNLRKERDPQRRTNILDEIDKEAVTKRLMDILDIRNREEQTIGITQDHIREIKDYLKDLDLILDCPTETAGAIAEPQEHILFIQPGMRYCQAQALVYSLMQDPQFLSVDSRIRTAVAERILEEVRGRMMEDIILLEATKALRKYKVFKLQFPRTQGEYDMVIYDPAQHLCSIFEIKHSRQAVQEQARHLLDEDKLALTEQRFCAVAQRSVIYLGESFVSDDGIEYVNAESFLKELPSFEVQAAPVEEEEETAGPTLSM